MAFLHVGKSTDRSGLGSMEIPNPDALHRLALLIRSPILKVMPHTFLLCW
ncbi:Conserved hypothetical protein [Prochlorococcus marinus str. MIT 9303]|uniref:Uncharacterized protein n=1 Tax=Prochlorococcus marinus (strain MIT 9303) TaxID=59922 RepID=A2C8J9_PROM3|nr:Conserved hypothetical protein [Prochlorococcus marinus str. MIT 9303]